MNSNFQHSMNYKQIILTVILFILLTIGTFLNLFVYLWLDLTNNIDFFYYIIFIFTSLFIFKTIIKGIIYFADKPILKNN